MPRSQSGGVGEASRPFVYDEGAAVVWTPHRPARPEKFEGGQRFKLVSDYQPAGDQPQAIAELVAAAKANEKDQVLLGVTGSGKTFTMAKVIEQTQRPALILAHNKTLAAQLANEFRDTLQLAPERLRLTSDVSRLQVHFDPSHLHQVVWNLCDNAVKHGAGERGHAIELRSGRVPSSGRPYLEVSDRGPGIDAADAERIFEPFFTNGVGGTGLGLALVAEHATALGGEAWVEDRPGGGARFVVRLPTEAA